MSKIITMLTDFGESDGYVASMKGVVLVIDPSATLVDITHQIRPQDVMAAAFVIDTAYSYFPKGTIHVVVVDPGVGSNRSALLVCVPDYCFVAPDNGVLTNVVSRWLPTVGPPFLSVVETEDKRSLHRVELPHGSPISIYRLTDERYFLRAVSQTFHGRDIFAPVAAHVSRGIPPEDIGERINHIHLFSLPVPQSNGDLITAEVIHIDRFGNMITNLLPPEIAGEITTVAVAGHVISGLSKSYLDGGDLLAIIGSSGRLEIAARNGSAAAVLGLGVGAKVEVRVQRK
ncbi:MAG: S-adenosyl-l-methionine hydroxide adenosyltransferase [Dehalococcoidia bacterium]|nr:S-adenosyl-l-methionine hydroxide adenosyltransferase [Dehalococcoidia bacterium]